MNVVGENKTHFTLSNFFPPENRTVYEIMWKIVMELDTPQKTIRRVACWIIKATCANAHAHARAPTPIYTAPPRTHTEL